MLELTACNNLFSLDRITRRIRKSSNFEFNWQFYHISGADPRSPATLRQAVELITTTPALHAFLRDSFQPRYDEMDPFDIQPLHEHCQVVPMAGEFENILARATRDRLGAYSLKKNEATACERKMITKLFTSKGEYHTYELQPGSGRDCPICRECPSSPLECSWFYGVAWDWCLLAIWPESNILWVGCLTDTD